MLLADVLALASRKVSKPAINEMYSLSPRLLVDFATLTGDSKSLYFFFSSHLTSSLTPSSVSFAFLSFFYLPLSGLLFSNLHFEHISLRLISSPLSILQIISLTTGTCVSSLSNRYIGAFTNRRDYSSVLIKAGEECGERVWPFPLDDDFEEDLKSDIADILQVHLGLLHSSCSISS